MTEEKNKKVPLNKEGLSKLLGVFKFMMPYKVPFFTGLFCLFISSFLVLAFPVLSGKILDVASGDSLMIGSGDLIKGIGEKGGSLKLENVTQVAVLLMIILLIQSGFSYLRVYLFAVVSERSIADMRKTVYSKMLNLPMRFFDKQRVGDMISRITSDISVVQETFSITVAELFRQLVILLIGITVIFFMVPDLALFMLAIFPPVILMTVFFGRGIRKLTKASQTHLGETNTIVDETLQSVLVVKAFTNEAHEIGRYAGSLGKVVEVALRAARYRGAFISFIVLAMFGSIVAVMWKGASLVGEGIITSGDLVSFVLLTMFIGASIAGLGDMYGQLQRAVGASQRILDVLEEDSEELDEKIAIQRFEGHIKFERVTFTYPETEKPVLKDIDFEIKPGQKVALVGPSGAGKSTITQLLMRFYDIESGQILVDGKSAYNYGLTSYRSNIGVVPQEVMLFGGTIRENIMYGNTLATEEQVVEAAEKANALEFIDRMDQGFDTIVGERGVKLSGGQRQRIAIARAILKDPAILILDEATSSLDAQSEILVQKALEGLMEGRTTVIIAHRLSTIRNVDAILVIKDGKIVERGNHEELSKIDEGLYSHLLKLQFQLT